MGIGTLRRHYEAEGAATTAPSTPQPVVEQHAEGNTEVERLTSANASLIEQAQHWKAEAVALGWEKPGSEDDTDAVAIAEQKVAYFEAELENWRATLESRKAERDAEADKAEDGEQEKAGDEGNTPEDQPELDYPARSAKTAEWVAFAEKHPTDPPLDLTPRTGLRDAIAAHYLGE